MDIDWQWLAESVLVRVVTGLMHLTIVMRPAMRCFSVSATGLNDATEENPAVSVNLCEAKQRLELLRAV